MRERQVELLQRVAAELDVEIKPCQGVGCNWTVIIGTSMSSLFDNALAWLVKAYGEQATRGGKSA